MRSNWVVYAARDNERYIGKWGTGGLVWLAVAPGWAREPCSQTE